jgi:hypothetical protein
MLVGRGVGEAEDLTERLVRRRRELRLDVWCAGSVGRLSEW